MNLDNPCTPKLPNISLPEMRKATQCEEYLEAHLKAVKTMLGVLEPEEIGKFIDKVLIGAEILRGKE